MKLKVGLIGAAQANFNGSKETVYAKSAEGFRALGARLDFDLYVHPAFVVTAEDAMQARDAVEREGVDFLIVQTTTFAAGEVIIHLGKTRAAIGLWGLPEATFKGSVFIDSRNSLCGINMYAGILASYLKEYAIKYKWFYGYVDGRMVRQAAGADRPSLIGAQKAAPRTRGAGWRHRPGL